jgi:capsular exopolysaccharide synthesis family protein
MADHLEADLHEEAEAGQQQSTLTPLRAVLRHRWLVMLGVVAGCVLGGLYYARTKPIYQSSAQVLVVKKTPDALPVAGPDARAVFTEDYLSTHQTLIRSPVIVAQAVAKDNLGALESFAGRGDPTWEIIGSLKLSRESNAGSPTTILNLSYRGGVAEDTGIVLEAVIRSYQQFLKARYKSVSDDTAKQITDAGEILEKRITRKQKEYEEFSREHPTMWKGKDGISLVQERLLTLEARRSALLLQETEMKGRIDAFEKAMKDGKYSKNELMAMIALAPGGKPGTETATAASALEERLIALELQEKTLLEDYGPNHPQVRSTRSQLALVRTQMQRLGKATAGETGAAIDPVKTHLQTLKLELENTRMGTEALGELLKTEQKVANGARGYEKRDEAYRAEIGQSQQLFDAITKRLNEVSILQNFSGGYEAETISPPGVGGQVYPKPTLVFGVAFMLGLLSGCGLAYLAELSDQSFRTPEEIRRRLGLPIIGHVPFFEQKKAEAQPVGAEGPRLDESLCAFNHPKSREAEAYRGVRTSLFFNAKATGRKVIQVTSPDKGDGKSTLATNLAVSIAQAEKKVILIDADFRRPRVHKIFNVPGDAGLASVIIGGAELFDVIQPTAVPGLFVLPCGPIPANPAELLTLPQFQEILGVLREQYDFVIIDTPPLLAVTDPCIVVPHVDGVILTVRISKNARPHAIRAREILAGLKATVLGVVVNGVGGDSQGYGYDSYRYGYTYKSYKYYTSYENDSYYASDEETPEGGTAAKASTVRSKKKKGFLSRLFGG